MAKLVRHLTSNEEIVSSNLAEGIFLSVALSIWLIHELLQPSIAVKTKYNTVIFGAIRSPIDTD